MQFRNGLVLFQRGHCGGEPASHYVIAAYHPPESITWTWLLWWWPPKSWSKPFGSFAFTKQKPMWRKREQDNARAESAEGEE